MKPILINDSESALLGVLELAIVPAFFSSLAAIARVIPTGFTPSPVFVEPAASEASLMSPRRVRVPRPRRP